MRSEYSAGRRGPGSRTLIWAVALAFVCLGLIGCSAAKQETATPAKEKQESAPPVKEFEDFNPNDFNRSTQVNNPWFPLKPGTRLVYEGFTIEDGEKVPHRVVFTVTDLVKEIARVDTVVCLDQDYSEGQLEEMEIVFFAQDNAGNVWHFGQYPEVYEDGKFVEAPVWIHGLKDGHAGIMMMAEPRLGMPSYSEGWAPSVPWTDRATVHQVGQKTCVPVKCYEDVLVIDETSKEEPDAHQLKYYARGVGYVRVGWSGEKEVTKETLELVKIESLDPKALAEVRAQALKLEKRAYQNSKDVYAQTAPARQAPASTK